MFKKIIPEIIMVVLLSASFLMAKGTAPVAPTAPAKPTSVKSEACPPCPKCPYAKTTAVKTAGTKCDKGTCKGDKCETTAKK
jgi:hypothetical protein